MMRLRAALSLLFVGILVSGAGVVEGQSTGSVATWGSRVVVEPSALEDLTQLSAGWGNCLGLRSDGTIVAWGRNDHGECMVPEPNADFAAVAAGEHHSLGLKSDSTIVAWGWDGYGQCAVPEPNAGFVSVAAGYIHSLAVKSDGTAVAWGRNASGQCNVPAPNADFMAVAGGAYHSLGLKSDGTIVAWGANGLGQCSVPAPNADFVAVAAGENHSLGLKSDGTIVAWGDNSDGQCTIPGPNAGFEAIAAGEDHSLGLKSDGTVVAWGWNGEGECDVPSPNADFDAVAGGGFCSLGLKSGRTLAAWGSNYYGQCNVPPPNAQFRALGGGGYYHSLGLRSDGTLVAWGQNNAGQCDIPAPNSNFVAVAGGGDHSLGLRSDGTVVAWGANEVGQALPPSLNADFVAIAAGPFHNLALRSDSTICGWGGVNQYGETDWDDGTAGYLAVAAGYKHSLGLRSDGTIVARGLNTDGQCDVPAPNADFVAVAAGFYHSLGLKADGTVVAWGRNTDGQCNPPYPNEGFVAVAGGANHSVALDSGGTVVGWGGNAYGQCSAPEPNSGYLSIACGFNHTLGLWNPNAFPMSGTFAVGPAGDYASLTTAFADVATRGMSGPVVLELQPSYVSTVETFPLTVGAFPGSSAENTVTVRPGEGAAGLSISSSSAPGALDLNGAANVIFDGRPAGARLPGELTIESTNTSGWAVRFINDARFNTLQYLTIKGVTTGSSSGVVHFSTTTGANGNDANTIDHCDLRSGATTPTNLVYSSGTTTSTAHHNSGNAISHCNLFDFFSPTATHVGVSLAGGNQDWRIEGSSFYETASRNMTGTGTLEWQAIASSSSSTNNLQILDNHIGGTAPECGGAPLTYTGNATLRALRLTVGVTTPTSIQGNTFRNISVTSTSASSSQTMIGLVSGSFNVGTEAPNRIGSQDATDDVTFALSNTSTAAFAGIAAGTGTPGTIVISNNLIGGISIAQVGGAGTATARGIHLAASSGSGTYVVSGNTIGSPDLPGSFSSANGTMCGIYGAPSGSYLLAAEITGNTIANLAYLGVTDLNRQLLGISLSGAGAWSVDGNTIHDLSSTSASQATEEYASVIGIRLDSGTSANRSVSHNRIHALGNTAATATAGVAGIVSRCQGTYVIASNVVRSLTLLTSGIHSDPATCQIIGILVGQGTSTLLNNMIHLGWDVSGNPLTTGYSICGVLGGGGLKNGYGNSVCVGGAGVEASGRDTYALWAHDAGSPRTYLDNVLMNARSNGTGDGTHYAVRYDTFASDDTSDHNDLYASGTGGVVGLAEVGGVPTDYPTLADWQAGTGLDLHSISADPRFVNQDGGVATGDLHIDTTIFPPSPVADAGVTVAPLTEDYDGESRGSAPDIGADEFLNYTMQASAGPHGAISPAGYLLVNAGTDLTFTLLPDSCYAVADVMVDTVSVGPVPSYTFYDIQRDHSIWATFEFATFTITALAGPGGTITPSGEVPVSCGDSQSFDIEAHPGFSILEVIVDGVPQGPVPTYVFRDVTSDHAIEAAFIDVAPPTVALTVPNGGEIWMIGSNQTITWTATDNAGVATVDLAYSIDGGASYPFVIATGLGNTGTQPWVVPDTPSTTCRVRVTARDAAGNAADDASDADFEIRDDASAVAEVLLGEHEVVGVYPNPAGAGAARVLFRLTQTGSFDVSIYDVGGRRVRTLGSGSSEAGVHAVAWDGRDGSGTAVPGGIYLVRLTAPPGLRVTKRFVLVR